MTQTDPTTTWKSLPDAVTTYLTAQDARDVATAITVFTADAEVTDEGQTYRGLDAIGTWIGSAASQYTYTTEFTGATFTGRDHVDVTQHLEGNFPGGVVDLHYRFTLGGGAITRLVIEP
jgi:hypothetical protein